MPYTYEPRPRHGQLPKQKWNKSYAAVEAGWGGEKVGMCPAGLSQDTLEHLLNSGIFYFGHAPAQEHPQSIFNVYDGVPYRAVKTNPGKSFHGFPCVSKRKDVPPTVLPRLLERADQLGVRVEVERWFKQYP